MTADPTFRIRLGGRLLTRAALAGLVVAGGLLAAAGSNPATPPPAGPEATQGSPRSGDGLVVSNARVRALIPGQDKTVGYLDLHNPTSAAITLVRAESDQVRAIEFHTTSLDGEVMRMRRLEQVVIEPGATRRFEPGEHHLMLFGVRSLPESLEIRLHTADEAEISVTFERIPVMAQGTERR